ncbi:phage tail protein [Gluconobacter sp. LMG 31484]|uniref:Phage tail protein n=1 Tax=Gluconobacter vitians TaxID=2728102 RepID=A0ABR9Y6F5_9PROT|nr:phage tail tip lysozyme [Gluconobacter vitians]MBF0859422.1 phage tail protein [Gluconobacter vitians]
MANKGVKVTISAVDRASQTVERLNARIAAMQAPVRRAQAALDRFSGVTGLRRLQGGITSLERAGVGAFRSLSQIVPVLGGITGAASLAGIYRLASAWGQFGTNLRTAANSMGMAPDRLMAMQNAARLSGGSADAMSSALQGLSQTRWEATHGFAPEAIVQFKALGISLQELQHLKPDEMFERVAKRIRSIRDPAAKVIAATQIFGGAAQGLMPILQQTEEQYQANVRQAERLGVMNRAGADAADRLRHAQSGLTEAVEGFGYSLAQSVEPVITPVVNEMRDWIAANREWISQDIAGYVRHFITWLRTGGWSQIKGDIKGVYDEVLHVVDGLGGWKATGKIALGGIALLYSAPVLTGIATLTAALLGVSTAFGGIALAAAGAVGAYEVWQHYKSPDAAPDPTNHLAVGIWKKAGGEQARAQQAYDYFRSQGRSRNAALGMVSNIDRESTFLETNSGDNGKAYGLGQWWPKRQERFKQLMGKDIRDSTFAEQLQFYNLELKKDYPYADANVNMARTPEAAAQALTYGYEQPKHQDTEAAIRGEMADQWAGKLGDAKLPPPPPPTAPQGLDQKIAQLRVEIDHRNAPPGSSVQVKSTTPGLKVHAISQHRAMDPALTAVGN